MYVCMYEKSKIPFSYMLCLFFKTAYRELNLERALDEDTGPGDFSFLSSSSPLGHVMYTRAIQHMQCLLVRKVYQRACDDPLYGPLYLNLVL